mgnify:FL=1
MSLLAGSQYPNASKSGKRSQKYLIYFTVLPLIFKDPFHIEVDLVLPLASCFKRPRKQLLSLTFIAASVTACGGGGGGSDDNQTGPATSVSNRAPSIQAFEPVSVLEGSQISVSVVSNDPDGDPLSKSIDGADASFFSFGSDDAVQFSTLPDWEAIEDSDSNNVFEAVVTVSDGQQSASANLEVTLIDALEGSVIIGVMHD